MINARKIGLVAVMALSGLAGCALPDGSSAQSALPADLMSPYGAYLSGRVAQEEHDPAAALAFYQTALIQDPTNVELANRVFILAVTEGHFELANPLAKALAEANPDAGLADFVVAVAAMAESHPDAAYRFGAQLPRDGFYRFAGALIRAWALASDGKQTDQAIAELAGLETNRSFGGLQGLHSALILDLAGANDAAAEAYRATLGTGSVPYRLVQLAGNFYERTGRLDEARALYQRFAAQGDTGIPVPEISPNGPPPRVITDAKHGLAEALFDLASLLSHDDSADVTLLNIRLALELEPKFPMAQLVLAEALETQHRPDEALAAYRTVDPAEPIGWTTRLRIAALLTDRGEIDAARGMLEAMAAERPDQPDPLITLGDLLRIKQQWAAAADAYSQALRRTGTPPGARYWSVYFSRGIVYEQAKDWSHAEADLKQALNLRPNQPEVLNYLGYSMVERGLRLKDALKLIQAAVDQKPDEGAYIDSLGWAYYRLGDAKQAQANLERAVELLPGDSEVNDHLGDAYWQGGRRDEARLQWRRALDLKPEAERAKAIQAKLDHPPQARHVSPTPTRPGG